MNITHLKPLDLQTWANPIPVLPAVPSTTVPPGLMLSSQRVGCLTRMTLSMYLQALLFGVTHDTNGSTIFDAPPGRDSGIRLLRRSYFQTVPRGPLGIPGKCYKHGIAYERTRPTRGVLPGIAGRAREPINNFHGERPYAAGKAALHDGGKHLRGKQSAVEHDIILIN